MVLPLQALISPYLAADSLQRAAAGGADGNDAVAQLALGLALMRLGCSLLADAVPLAVHLVVGDLILACTGRKVPRPTCRVTSSNVDPLGADGIHQLRGKVQAGRGGGGAAQLLGVDGLVLALVLQLAS